MKNKYAETTGFKKIKKLDIDTNYTYITHWKSIDVCDFKEKCAF